MDYLQQFKSLGELVSYVRLKFQIAVTTNALKKDLSRPSLKQCFDLLRHSGRSFYLNISALKGLPRDSICIYYLIVRAMDTIEDDMTIPCEVKHSILRSFDTIVRDEGWSFTQSQDKDAIVLEMFPSISKEFNRLPESYQDVIMEDLRGIAESFATSNEIPCHNLEEFEKYCRYSAGIPLIQMRQMLHMAEPVTDCEKTWIENFGHLFQMTNDLRDIRHDIGIDRKRLWPESVWKKYTKDIKDLILPENEVQGLACLNELVTYALDHVPSCVSFLKLCPTEECLKFFAVLQVMAVATLERLYNNPQVFRHVIKIRKGEAAYIMVNSTSMQKVKAMNVHYISKIQKRVPKDDPNYTRTRQVCEAALSVVQDVTTPETFNGFHLFLAVLMFALFCIGLGFVAEARLVNTIVSEV